MDHFVSTQPYFVLGNEDLENPRHDHHDDDHHDRDWDLSDLSDIAPSTTLLALGTIVVFQSAIILLIRFLN